MLRRSLLALFASAAAAACAAGPASSGSAGAALEVEETVAASASDIAILFPLAAGLWPASRALGDGRALLPEPILQALGALVEGDSAATTYPRLRVVSLRLEPCFRRLGGAAVAAACEHQLRFVLQPVVVDPRGTLPTTTLDAAVHVIYALPPAAFAELVRELVALRPADAPASSTLGVHPRLAAEGSGGAFGRELERRVLAKAAQGRLTRVTSMGVRGRGNEWHFAGVEIGPRGELAPVPIPAAGARLQSLVLQRGAQTFLKSLSPPTAGADDLSLLFDSLSATAASTTELRGALRAANRIESPELRSSEDTDCATCHTVASSRAWAERTFGLREDPDRFLAGGVESGAGAVASADLGVLRAFGYFGSEIVISKRAVNEIARATRIIRGESRP